MPPDASFDATVLITTKNRKDELRKALASCVMQKGNIEILVIDDGSTDGTSEMVRAEFPSVRVDRAEQSRGYIVHRNRGAELARSPYVFSIDDDAEFTSPDTVMRTVAEFSHPRIGAVAIPFIDVHKSPKVQQQAPDDKGLWVFYGYRGTAHALRRDLFLALGGYREVLTHQTEESDYCVRMLQAGYITRLGNASPINHYESARRDLTRQMTFVARNNVLFAWHNAPGIMLLPHIVATSINSVRHGARNGYTKAVLSGLLRSYGECLGGKIRRRPVRGEVYKLFRGLHKPGPQRIEAVEPLLAPIRPPSEIAAQRWTLGSA